MIQTSMTSQRFRVLALMAILLTLVSAVSFSGTTTAQVSGTAEITIKNFGKINEAYYRGAQPRRQEMQQLKRLGIKTVIDLREDKEAQESEWASGEGLQYFNIDMKPSRAATEEQTAYFMSLVNNPSNWPVYVHCKGGRHRTGALTAAYRITHDGWTADQAFEEMKKYDFDHGFFGGPSAQKKFVFSFYQRYVVNHHQK
jgi:protein tyrosine/serine phosphatase